MDERAVPLATKSHRHSCQGDHGVDSTMSRLTTRTFVGAAALVVVGTPIVASLPVTMGLTTVAAMLVGALGVSYSTQAARVRDEGHQVYRPVYVRPSRVGGSVRSIES